MKFPEDFRLLTHPKLGTKPGEPFGMFFVGGRYACGRSLLAMACDGEETGWEHVSVSLVDNQTKFPSWQEMSLIKDLFWNPEEAVMQLHPPASQYVNNHEGCLHLWRPLADRIAEIPLPPPELVGVLGVRRVAA
jgi:hypothetical protein